ISIGERDMRDADRVARFKELERSLAVDAKDGVFDLGVGGGVDAAAKKFVAGVDVFDFAERARTENVCEYNGVAGVRDRKIRFGGTRDVFGGAGRRRLSERGSSHDGERPG